MSFLCCLYHHPLSAFSPSCHLSTLLCPIKSVVAKGQDPVFIDCVGSSHITGDLCSQSPLWLSALVCSCGESWHSSPVGQSAISLHCKECNTICNDWATDNDNLHEKQLTDDLLLFFLFFSSKLQRSGKMSFASFPTPVKSPLINLKSFVMPFIPQIMKLINCSRSIKCQTVCIFVRVNTSPTVNSHDKCSLKSQKDLRSLLLHYVMGF